jgi:hypothetical protein
MVPHAAGGFDLFAQFGFVVGNAHADASGAESFRGFLVRLLCKRVGCGRLPVFFPDDEFDGFVAFAVGRVVVDEGQALAVLR